MLLLHEVKRRSTWTDCASPGPCATSPPELGSVQPAFADFTQGRSGLQGGALGLVRFWRRTGSERHKIAGDADPENQTGTADASLVPVEPRHLGKGPHLVEVQSDLNFYAFEIAGIPASVGRYKVRRIADASARKKMVQSTRRSLDGSTLKARPKSYSNQ